MQNARNAKMQNLQQLECKMQKTKCKMHIIRNAKCSLLATLPSTLRTAHWLSVAQIEGGIPLYSDQFRLIQIN